MKVYENWDNFNERKHVIEVTFQTDKYKWTIKKEVSWNCFWSDILSYFWDFDEIDTEHLLENNIKLEDLWNWWIRYYLKNDEWGILEREEEIYDLRKSVVKIEIVDCKILED